MLSHLNCLPVCAKYVTFYLNYLLPIRNCEVVPAEIMKRFSVSPFWSVTVIYGTHGRHYGIYPEVCEVKDGSVLSELV